VSSSRQIDSPLGPLLLSADRAGRLTGVRIGAETGARPFGEQHGATGVLDVATEQLEEYFAGRRTEFSVPVAMAGTPFQQWVWEELRRVGFGTTVSYGELAARMGRSGAARAVGHANARNPVAVIVPCHRVVGASGALTGYRGGLAVKRLLLDLEARQVSPPGPPHGPVRARARQPVPVSGS